MFRVIKIGGKLIEDTAVLSRLCDKLSACYPDCVLVHGGGSMAGQLSSRLGIETCMHEGRRITDRETLDVTVMAYAGLANKRVVAALQAWGVNACGLSGCDMGIVKAHKREVKDIDWGYVGDIDTVDAGALGGLLDKGVMPVLSPITFNAKGELLNTNADSVAAAIAIALSGRNEVELVYCFDKPGVLLDVDDPHSVVHELDYELYQKYLKQGLIHSGMIPKLENAFRTIDAGVTSVRLTSPAALEGGTAIKAKS